MWFLRPPNSRRRWHVFTWLAAVPALLFITLVQVAGVFSRGEELLVSQPRWYHVPNPDAGYPRQDQGDPPDFDADINQLYNRLPEEVWAYQHGWPTPWVHRELGFGAGPWRPSWRSMVLLHEIPTSLRFSRWPITADAWRVAPLGLAVNLLVALGVIAIPMLATETWLRRRGGLGRFKIIDYLVVVAVVAAGFGFWRWDQAAAEKERRIAQRIEHTDFKGQFDSSYVGPEWIARLVDKRHLPFLHRHTRLHVKAIDIPYLDYEALAQLKHLKYVEVDCSLLEWREFTVRLADLAQLAQVRELSLWVSVGDQLSAAFAAGDLNLLTQIETVKIDGAPALETALAFRQLPNLREIHLRTDWFDDEELATLESTFQGIKIVPLGDPRRPPYRNEQITVRRWGHGCELSSDAQTLTLTADPSLPAERLKEIERVLPRIEKLKIQARYIDTDICEYFTKMTSLEVLTLDLQQFPEGFADHITQLPKLRRLRFENRKPSLETLLLLQEHKHLTLSFSRLAWNVGGNQDAFREAFGERIEIGFP